MVRNTLACLASAPSAVEVRNLHHQVRLDQGIILVYDMSIEVNDFQLVYKSLQHVFKMSYQGNLRPLLREVKRQCFDSKKRIFIVEEVKKKVTGWGLGSAS